jgi:HlyD family secretion protein
MNERVIPGTPRLETPGKWVRSEMAPTVAPSVRTGAAGLRKYWLTVGLLAVVLAAAAVAWSLLGATSTIHYTTVPVTQGAITPSITATGTVNPELTIIVGTYVSGPIQALYCDYNTRVKKGQICAKIDPRPYQTVVDQSKANLAIAKAQLEKDKASLTYAKLTLERDEKLVQTNAVSRDVVDSARSNYEQAKAQLAFDEATTQQRTAALDAAQVNLDYTDIVSPVDGIVVSRNVTMGQTVAASFQTPTLFLIATDLTKMELDTNVSESDIRGIKQGNAATFTVDAFPKRTFSGTVSQIRQSPQTVQNVVTYDVVVSVDNSGLALMPGMTAASRIVIAQRNDVLRVPNQALRYVSGRLAGTNESGQPQVWVLRDGQPVPISVALGLEDGSFTEVSGGNLQPGDQVITGEQAAAGRTATPRPRF